MRKAYVKPEIFFEDFSLSTSIASCAVVTSAPNEGQLCGYAPAEGWDPIFADTTKGCVSITPEGENTLCYDVPTDSPNLFNS